MSKDIIELKAAVKKLILKNWTKTEVTKLDEFMEDVIIATMRVNDIPIHIVLQQIEPYQCVSSESILYRNPCKEWCKNENCRKMAARK